jgi:hypothetical protein
VKTPVLDGCGLYYECRIVARQRIPMEQLEGIDNHEDNSDGHYHLMIYGVIEASYSMD